MSSALADADNLDLHGGARAFEGAIRLLVDKMKTVIAPAVYEVVVVAPLVRVFAWIPESGCWNAHILRRLAAMDTISWSFSMETPTNSSGVSPGESLALIGEYHITSPREWVLTRNKPVESYKDSVKAGPAWHVALQKAKFPLSARQTDSLANLVLHVNCNGEFPCGGLEVRDHRVMTFSRAVRVATLQSLLMLSDASSAMNLDMSISPTGTLTWVCALSTVAV